jgi:flavin reductase (DIM6/NTAB) family NADH-FMN oxidoreductase RutF
MIPLSDIAPENGLYSLNPADLGQQNCYKLLIGSVLPRPIAFVSTVSADGIPNLAPFSFFNAVASNPPSVLFTTTRRGSDGQKKDTLLNIEATGEFVVNVVTEEIVEQMNQTSAEYGRGISEFTATGLTPIPSDIVKAPRVKESPINMECKLLQIVEVGDGSLGSGNIIIGEVVRFHLAERVFQNGHVLVEELKPVARLAGSGYCPVREVFSLARPVIPETD